MRKWLDTHILNQTPLFTADSVVEVDEMYCIHTYERAIGQYSPDNEVEGVWVFGAISRDGRRLYLQATCHRRKATLQPILYKYCERGCTIVSVALSSYYSLDRGFDYFRINKKVEGFAREEELASGEVMIVNVNHIENRWRWLRQHYRDGHHTAAQYVQRVLDECMYRFYEKSVRAERRTSHRAEKR